MLYIIHFDQKIADHAGHYAGCCADGRILDRFLEHRTGYGARLTQVAVERGIGMQLAATFEGGYTEEKILKLQKNTPRFCPICREQRILEKMFQHSERGRHDATA